MLLGGDDAAILLLETEATILRVVGEPLQCIRGFDLRNARFADGLELRNEPVRIGCALAQCPQPFLRRWRQKLDHVEGRWTVGPAENGRASDRPQRMASWTEP